MRKQKCYEKFINSNINWPKKINVFMNRIITGYDHHHEMYKSNQTSRIFSFFLSFLWLSLFHEWFADYYIIKQTNRKNMKRSFYRPKKNKCMSFFKIFQIGLMINNLFSYQICTFERRRKNKGKNIIYIIHFSFLSHLKSLIIN